MRHSLEHRMDRIERAFLSFAAIVSGEAALSMTPDELSELQTKMASDMKEMADAFHY